MPRSGPRRPSMTIRISQDGLAALARLEAKYGKNRSEVARELIGYGLQRPVEILGDPPSETDSGAA